MSKRMAKLYEKAWNEVVDKQPDWKKKIIIENFPYNDPSDKRMSDEVVRDAVRFAERWERVLKGKVTTPAP